MRPAAVILFVLLPAIAQAQAPCGTTTVTQSPATLTSPFGWFDGGGGIGAAWVVAPTPDCTWVAQTAAAWISFPDGVNGAGSRWLRYTVAPPHLTSAVAGRAHRHPGERTRPGDRARQPLEQPREPERERPAGDGEAEAGGGQHEQAEDDRVPGADAPREQAAGDPARERARAERADEEARFELAERELVGVAGDERDDRAEQCRVDEDDRADDGEQTAHEPKRTRERKRSESGVAVVRTPD